MTEFFTLNPDASGEPIKATIGQYAEYLVYDPEGLGGEPRIFMRGREWTQEEIAAEQKIMRAGRALFGDWIIDRVKEMKKEEEE
jgi:hypothetical protein